MAPWDLRQRIRTANAGAKTVIWRGAFRVKAHGYLRGFIGLTWRLLVRSVILTEQPEVILLIEDHLRCDGGQVRCRPVEV